MAACLDQSAWPEIVGTIAGDDSILLVVREKDKVDGVISKFEQLMN